VNELNAELATLASRAGVRGALVTVNGSGHEAQRAAGERAASLLGATLRGRGDDGRPLWDDEVVGSIAHTDDEAVAIVASSRTCVAVGVDLERAAALPHTDARLVLDERECAALDDHAQPDWLATLVWSAKEAAFKAWSSATNGALGTVNPVDIHVDVDERAKTLTVDAAGTLGSVVKGLVPSRGFYAEAGGRVLTLVTLPATSSG
jgi:4'-phosphopantetheinyl transferase EntD